MFGIDPLTIGSFLILAAGQELCALPKPTEINVKPKTQDIKYDFTQTLSELQAHSTDTIDPYGFHGITITQGFMQGSIGLKPRVSLGYRTYPKLGASCIWYDTISIEIEIIPEIVIAKEVYQDKCMRKAVLDHEMKHVYVDREIVNKYAKKIGKKVYDAIKQRGFISKPFPSEDIKKMQARMQKVVTQIVEHEYKKMDLERTEGQRAVDSLEEYERVSALCPDFAVKRATLLRKK